jgi:alpha-tubulin suppressor-like RCC1 family protein
MLWFLMRTINGVAATLSLVVLSLVVLSACTQSSDVGSTRAVTIIGAGIGHTAAVLDDGTLYTWGANFWGQLGDGTTTDRPVPTLVPNFPPPSTTITSISLGFHNVALLSDGSLYTWGYGFFGQLGYDAGEERFRTTPKRVPNFPPGTTSIVSIAAGNNHTVALLDDGTLYTWGLNWKGQLGHSSMGDPEFHTIPTPVPNFPPGSARITHIVAGGDYTAALLDDGTLYTWGSNVSGELGVVGVAGVTPQLVKGELEGRRVVDVAGGGRHMAALVDDGSLYAWGFNDFGQLGDASRTKRGVPTLIAGFGAEGAKVSRLTLGQHHSAAQLDDGTVSTWGDNLFGQLGDGTTVDVRSTPGVVPSFPPGTASVQSVAAGDFHMVVLLDDGSLYTWGDNALGQLGHGPTIALRTPTRVTAFD